MIETKKHKIAKLVAMFFLRSGRGQGLTNRIMDPLKDILQGTVYIFAIKEMIGWEIEPSWLIWIVLSKTIIEYLIGWADQVIGFWKVENEYATHELNPFNTELMKRIKQIEKSLKEQ